MVVNAEDLVRLGILLKPLLSDLLTSLEVASCCNSTCFTATHAAIGAATSGMGHFARAADDQRAG